MSNLKFLSNKSRSTTRKRCCGENAVSGNTLDLSFDGLHNNRHVLTAVVEDQDGRPGHQRRYRDVRSHVLPVFLQRPLQHGAAVRRPSATSGAFT